MMRSSTPVHLLLISLRATRWLVMSMLLCGVAAAQTIKPGDIEPFEVEYEVGNNLINAGTAVLRLEKNADLWTYSLNTKPRGVFKLAGKGRISESSTFTLEERDGEIFLQPQQYTFRQDEERRRAIDASFDWDAKTLTHVYRGNEVTQTLEEPVLDRLTVTLLIMNALRHDFEKAELPIFDTDKIKQVEFIHTGYEELKTPLGMIETHRVLNLNAKGGSRETTTWFAPSLDYLPVKIEHRKRGDLVARLSLIRLKNRDTDVQLGEAMPTDQPIGPAEEEALQQLINPPGRSGDDVITEDAR